VTPRRIMRTAISGVAAAMAGACLLGACEAALGTSSLSERSPDASTGASSESGSGTHDSSSGADSDTAGDGAGADRGTPSDGSAPFDDAPPWADAPDGFVVSCMSSADCADAGVCCCYLQGAGVYCDTRSSCTQNSGACL
jgi:hypothetical protein